MLGFAMSIVAPKGRTHRAAEALFQVVRTGFANLPDQRSAAAEMPFTAALRSAFAMFSLKSPSLLAFDKHRAEGKLGPVYSIGRVPCGTQRREILDPGSPEA